jgi:hypothetical protein
MQQQGSTAMQAAPQSQQSDVLSRCEVIDVQHKALGSADVLRLLREANVPTSVKERIKFRPPSGSVLLFEADVNSNVIDDWRCDGYFWLDNGHQKLPK